MRPHQADLILNIICSEQELAQQKVSLAMFMMNPEMQGRQYHLSYDLVKLTTGKMSGRRGRYLLADDLYDELKEVIREKMAKKYADKVRWCTFPRASLKRLWFLGDLETRRRVR